MVLESERSAPRIFKTLSRREADFAAYLDGSFSDDKVALPLRSLNVGTQTEEVTCEIVDDTQIARPSIFAVARALVRPSTLVFSLGPMLTVWSRAYAERRDVNIFLAVACFIGVLAFHIATNLFNDYGDHMKGQDRVRPGGGSRAIQNGWIRAKTVRQAALGLTGFAALCGVPAILRSPVVIAAAFALLFTMEFAFQRLRMKARGWSEGLAFLLTGPVLTTAFVWAISQSLEAGDLLLGCVFGTIALLYFHSANFENIMADSQAGARTWATRAGFDASKTFYHFVVALILAASLALAIFDRPYRLGPIFVVNAALLLGASSRVHALTSPLSSGLTGLRSKAVRVAWLTTALALLGYLGTAWAV